MDADERDICNYLKSWPNQFVAGREICRRAGGKRRFREQANWAIPILVRLVEKGLVDSFHAAFEKFIGVGGPAYESKFQLGPQEAFQLISSAGGLSFLAHPGSFFSEQELLELIKLGLDGIEVVHPSHGPQHRQYFRGIVNQYFLLESGGSDYHGGKKNDEHAFGVYTVPMHVVETMRSRLFS